ncbi:lipoprotein [Mycoplasma yeatsii]|uniref:lipoprotein n=1 Tax=Mycoplasma yeatsii TaxID=51365 RepID=UPI0005B24DB9|nr:lipoprotein [Mycoplasma yeatsii]AJM71755.1 lipoprotein [Mycoplasma yeatsii GM274B]
MKKLLTILGSVAMVATTGAVAVACKTEAKKPAEDAKTPDGSQGGGDKKEDEGKDEKKEEESGGGAVKPGGEASEGGTVQPGGETVQPGSGGSTEEMKPSA